MDVSIGVMAYNESENIVFLLEKLLSQKTRFINIKEIVVVASGCTDNTCELVKSFSLKYKKIKLFEEKNRFGKTHAINIFLNKSRANILVLESADTIPEVDAIENLCLPLRHDDVGITASRPVPLKSGKSFFDFLSSFLWDSHDQVSKLKPKFGELIAFKRLFDKVSLSAVDEEEIASLVMKREFMGFYVPKAVVYNKGPQTISDFICQRRRIFAGHLLLRKNSSYSVSTINYFRLLKVVFNSNYFFKNPLYFLFAISLEFYSRFLGWLDFVFGKKHVIWKVAKSTKKL